MKHYDYLVDDKVDERIKRLKGFQKVKSTAAESYKSNTSNEDKCIEFLISYNERYLSVQKNRKVPLMVTENEYNVKKCVCSSIRPTTLPFADLSNAKEISNFIAHYVKHLPLSSPTEFPRHLFSPSSVLESCLGDSFEISTLLCSLLLGVGYDAYVVSGVAPQSVVACEDVDSSSPERNDTSEIPELATNVDPATAIKACLHSWVFIASGSRELTENCFIDPFTGQLMSTKLSPYSAIDSIWNHTNYWINTHLEKAVGKIRYDFTNPKHWLPVFYTSTDPQTNQKLAVPPSSDPPPFSWVLPIVLNRKKYQNYKPQLPPAPAPLWLNDKKDDLESTSAAAAERLTRPVVKSVDGQGTGLISDLFDKSILTHLEALFTSSKYGNNSLTTLEFKSVIAEYIPLKLVENICRAIDVNDTGYVNYSSFTSYLIAAEAGSSLSAKTYITRLVKSHEQPEQPGILHRDFIDFLVYVKKPCPMVISGGRDGQLQLWEPQELSLITPVQHRDNNAVYQEDLFKSMDTVLRAQCSKFTIKKPFRSKVPITSVCSLLNSGLLCVGSADGCVTIYELGNQDVCGRFSVEAVPTAIECFSTLQHTYYDADSAGAQSSSAAGSEVINRYVAVGDSTGCVHLICLHQEFELSTDVGMKNKNQQYFAVSVKENYTRKSVHSGWINQMKYIAEVDSLVSASVDGTISFLDVMRGTVSKVFTGHQEGGSSIGVKTFSFSAFSKYIVSGGDRTMLWWDPFTLEVIMKIDTFRSPIVSIEVHDHYNKVFAILSNKTISVWHNITFEVLQVITDTTTYKPTDNLSAMVFAPDTGCLFTAGHKISTWRLERSTESMTRQDEEDLVVVLFNPLYHQVVMVKSLGLVKIYQAESGEIVRQFKVIPLDSKTGHPKPLQIDRATGLCLPVIKHACFDKQLTRLVVTGFDLSVQLWNINDGSNLMQVQPQLYSTTLAHTYANLPRSISTVTYESVNYGEQKTFRKFIFIGNEYGNICGYQESNSAIEDVPVIFFRVGDTSKNQVEYYKSLAEEAEGVAAGGGKEVHLKSMVKQMIHKKHIRKPTAPSGPAPSSNKFIEAKFSHSTVSRGDVFDREGLACTDNAVLWVKYIDRSPHLLVAYLSGIVTFWDLEKNVRTHDLSFADMGPLLEGMKLKTGEKLLAEPAEAVVKYLPTSGGAAGAGETEEERNELDPEGKREAPFDELTVKIPESSEEGDKGTLQKAVTRLQTQRRVSAAFLHKARVKKEAAISLPTVIEAPTPVPPAAPPAAPTDELTGSTASAAVPVPPTEPALATTGSLIEALGSVSVLDDISSLGVKSDELLGPESTVASEGRVPTAILPPLAHGKRRDSAAAIAKSFNPSRKNVLLPRRSTQMNNVSEYGIVELDAYQQPAGHHNVSQSFVSSTSTTSLEPPPAAPRPLQTASSVQSLASTASDGSSYSSSTAATHDPIAAHAGEDSAPKILVDCVAVLSEAQVIIGACSDKYLRFWDLSSHHILCSCCYYHRSEAEQEAMNKAHANESHGHHRAVHHTFVHKNGTTVGGGMRHHTHHHHGHKHQSEDHHKQGKLPKDSAPIDEVLRYLKVSDSEDLLIGAYDNGIIRLWSIQSYSIVTLRSLLSKHQNKDLNDGGHAKDNNFGYGLAISPITLVYEWTAHRSPVLSIEYLWFEDEASGATDAADDLESVEGGLGKSRKIVTSRPASHHSDGLGATTSSPSKKLVSNGGRREKKSDMGQEILEGYIMSAGLDQRVFLWNVKGQCVGEFGSFGWDIGNESTWFKKTEALLLMNLNANSRKNKAKSVTESSEPSPFDYVDYDDTSHILTSFGRHKHHTVKELSSYVEELTKKILNKPPSYLDVNKQFSSILETHPIKVIKDGKYRPAL